MRQYSYRDVLAASERISWRVEDLIGGERQLDFARPFLPEALARVTPLDFLSADEQRTLNQIRGHGYLYTFGLVEEFILPFVMDHAREDLDGDDYRTQALLRFAAEEAKHIHLFREFRSAFRRDFGHDCQVIGPPEAIAEHVLSHRPFAVALLILHIEWMTQGHYVESVRDDRNLDPQFKSLLKHHWMEEAQHAKLDTLMVERMAADLTAQEIAAAVEEYMAIGGFFDEGLRAQVDFDRDAFERATGRTLNAAEAERFVAVQHQAQRWTYIGSGMSHANVLRTLEHVEPALRPRVEDAAQAFC